jgi:hypothetical protein
MRKRKVERKINLFGVISESLTFSETDRGVLTATITHPSFASGVCLNEYWSGTGRLKYLVFETYNCFTSS